MKIVVLKFGGTSVGTTKKIKKIAEIIANYKKKNNKVIVISSAMSGVTNELIKKSFEISDNFTHSEYDVLVSSTKVGNVIMLERTTGRPIFDMDFVKTPKSKINTEITSPYQIKITKPEPITKFEWSPKDIDKINNNFSKKILNNLNDFEFGLFVPPAPNKSYIFMAEGPIWEGAAINLKNI